MSSLRTARRRSQAAVALAATALLTLTGTTAAQAATGDLDPTWSADGLQTQAGGAGIALASAVLTDGRLLVAGTGSLADGSVSNGGTYVARYTAAGALDTTFGTGGTAKVSVAPGAEFVRDVVVDPTGRVIVGGYVAAPDYPDETDVFVLRLTAAGAVDTTFGGGDGIVILDRTNHDRGGALALSGSRILVGAGLDDAGNWGLLWTIFALTSTGATDTSFSGDGVASVPTTLVGSFDSLRDVLVQPDGKILMGGSSGSMFASARMTAAGVLDGTYSGDGVVTTPVEGGGTGNRLLRQADGKVVVVGYAHATGRSDTDMAAVRWTSAGVLDPTFGGDGSVLADGGANRNETGRGAALAADGKIVLVGSSDTATGLDSAVTRLNWNGTLDTSFSGDGRVTTSTLATSNEALESVVLGAGDRVRTVGSNLNGWTLLGYSGGANYTLAVADATVVEGNTGTLNATFQVTLSPASPQPVTVRYATANGTAVAPGDYTSRSGTLTFAAGSTSATITVPVVGDTAAEADETLRVQLSLPTNAGILDGAAVGTIRNND